jgi:hypothetical protein
MAPSPFLATVEPCLGINLTATKSWHGFQLPRNPGRTFHSSINLPRLGDREFGGCHGIGLFLPRSGFDDEQRVKIESILGISMDRSIIFFNGKKISHTPLPPSTYRPGASSLNSIKPF